MIRSLRSCSKQQSTVPVAPHPRVLHLPSLRDPIATGEAVVGSVMLAASWLGRQNT
jgi:hypothetical protein